MTESTPAAPPVWRPVSDRVWCATVAPDTVNVGLIAGRDGSLLVDCGSTSAQGSALRASAEAVAGVPVVALVVTHGHHDHVGGLDAYADLVTVGHAALPQTFTKAIALATVIDLGDRRVEVAHLGEGHTASDLVVVVPDAGVVVVGDLLESAGPPWFGPDSSPAQWPATLDGVIGLLDEHSTVVPGHGEPMDREAVFLQRSALAAVAGEIARLASTGAPVEQAADRGTWALPFDHIEPGLAAGYAEVGGARSGRSLPLV